MGMNNNMFDKKEKPDYKKSYFEKMLNDGKHSLTSVRKRMNDLGYFYEFENGQYHVYDSYEWKIKKEFSKTVQPLFDQIISGLL